jgi:hypothetical protein
MSIKRTKTAARRLGFVLTLALATSPIAPTAWAQSPPTPEAIKEAESRFKEGLRRHDSGDEENARLSFLEAFSVLKRPNILFNLARAEQLTGHPVDAIAHYKLFVADNTVTAVDREIARKRIVELSAIVGHVIIDAPSGADLWIDGQMLPRKAPLSEPADVAGGMHTIQARLGDQTKTATVACSPGQTVTTKIVIEGTPGAGVVVVAIPGEGGQAAATVATAPPAPTFHEETSKGKIGLLIGLGAGAVGLLAGGIGLEVAGSSSAGTAATDRTALQKGGTSTTVCNGSTSTACTNLASENSSASSARNTAIGLFVGAGVFAAAFGVTLAVWPKTKVFDAQVTPVVTPTSGGLALGGRF